MKKTLDEQIEIMIAFNNGAKIEEYSLKDLIWKDCENPSWDWKNSDFRVKKEKIKHYRAYKDVNELLQDYHNHNPYNDSVIWIKHKCCNKSFLISGYNGGSVFVGDEWLSLKYLFDNFVYLDGTFFGAFE